MNLETKPEFEQRAEKCLGDILAAAKNYKSEHPGITVMAREKLNGKLRGLDLLAGVARENNSILRNTLQSRADKLDQKSANESILSVSGESSDQTELEGFLPILDKIVSEHQGLLDETFAPAESTHRDTDRIRQDHPDLKPFFCLFYSFAGK